MTVVYRDKSEAILQGIIQDCELGKPGAGMAFVVAVEGVVGILYLPGKGYWHSGGAADCPEDWYSAEATTTVAGFLRHYWQCDESYWQSTEPVGCH